MSEEVISKVLKLLPYGFYSITSRNGDEVNAMVANWLTQVSFSPRLLALGLAKNAYSHRLVSQGKVFAVNIFDSANGKDAILPVTKGRAKNPEKMEQARYSKAPLTGCPILEGAAAYIECKVKQIVDVGGDHDIVVGEVVGGEILEDIAADDTLTLPKIGWNYAG